MGFSFSQFCLPTQGALSMFSIGHSGIWVLSFYVCLRFFFLLLVSLNAIPQFSMAGDLIYIKYMDCMGSKSDFHLRNTQGIVYMVVHFFKLNFQILIT